MPGPRPHLVLANGNAGSTSRRDVAIAVSRLSEHAPTRLAWTSSPEELESAVRASGDHQLVIAGGDGSIHLALATLDALARTEDPVGIIPLGTGNDFARNHDLPLDPEAAAEVVIDGEDRPVDAIELTDGEEHVLVANNLHVGIGVASARAAQRWKPTLGRFAYPLATAYTGATGGPLDLRVTVEDDVVWDGPLLACLALLGPSMGGGVELVDTVQGAIDIVVIEPVEARGRAALVRDALRGPLTDSPLAHRWTGQHASLQGDGGIEADVDGELFEHGPALDLRLRPSAWRVLLPREGAGG